MDLIQCLHGVHYELLKSLILFRNCFEKCFDIKCYETVLYTSMN